MYYLCGTQPFIEDMWIWVVIIAAVTGAVIGFARSGKGEDALGGAAAGGCVAASCLIRIAIAAAVIIAILWLAKTLFT